MELVFAELQALCNSLAVVTAAAVLRVAGKNFSFVRCKQWNEQQRGGHPCKYNSAFSALHEENKSRSSWFDSIAWWLSRCASHQSTPVVMAAICSGKVKDLTESCSVTAPCARLCTYRILSEHRLFCVGSLGVFLTAMRALLFSPFHTNARLFLEARRVVWLFTRCVWTLLPLKFLKVSLSRGVQDNPGDSKEGDVSTTHSVAPFCGRCING